MTSLEFKPLPNGGFSEGLDWSYNMRREMQEIVPGLFLGPYAVAAKSKLQNLKNKEITHIVCIRHEMERKRIQPNFPDDFKYLVLELSDVDSQNVISFFPQVNAFIEDALQQGGKVLVHGNGGNSRSAVLVAAYIMQRHELTHQQAFAYLVNRRFCICLNEGFLDQLKEYEPIYKAQLACPVPARPVAELKRKYEPDDDEEGGMDCEEGTAS